MIELYPFQKKSHVQIDAANGRALLAHEMGLGKTPISLKWTMQKAARLPVLVVCPAVVKHNWEREAQLVGLSSNVCEGETPPAGGRMIGGKAPVTIINYDVVRYWLPYLQRQKYKTVIFDECHYLANPKTKRTKACRELARDIRFMLALSGTPMLNRPIELWPILNMLWPDEYDSYWAFGQEYCAARYQRWGWDYRGSSNLPELSDRLKKSGMIRYRKADVLKELPNKVLRRVGCTLSDYDQYHEASTDFIGWLKKHAGHKVRSAQKAEKLVRIGELLRLTARLKLRSVVDWANRFMEETDDKLILFAIHHKAINVLKRRIDAQSVVITGKVNSRDRKLAVDQFQNQKHVRLFIANLQSAGVGIPLTAARDIGHVELFWRPGDHMQADARPHRIGQKRTVFSNYFVALNTIEEDLCQIIRRKQKVITSVMDGEQAIEKDVNSYEALIQVLEGRMK